MTRKVVFFTVGTLAATAAAWLVCFTACISRGIGSRNDRELIKQLAAAG